MPDGRRVETVVAIRMRHFGDVLATLPALRALRAHAPERRVVYVVDRAFHALLDRFDFIDELVASPRRGSGVGGFVEVATRLRAHRPIAVVDFHGNARSALLTAVCGAPVRAGFDVRVRRIAYTAVEPRAIVEDGVVIPRTSSDAALALARRVGATGGPAFPEIPELDGEADRAVAALREAGVSARALDNGGVVGLNPGRPYPAKAWPLDRFAALGRMLQDAGRDVVVLWGPGEESAARAVADAAGPGVLVGPPSTLAELPAVLRALRAIVTIDSGLKHLAVCAGVPTVTLFGSTSPEEWHMGAERDVVLWKGLSCSPCRRSECPFGTPCMDFVPHDVVSALTALEGGAA